MDDTTLERLTKEAEQPDDIAPVMGCGELRRLLKERSDLLAGLRRAAEILDRAVVASFLWAEKPANDAHAVIAEASK